MLDKDLFKIIEKSLDKSYFLQYTNNFSYRIIVQKLLYLLTHGRSNPKLSLPYSWNFYLRGPYSPGIAHMIYHMDKFKSDLINESLELEERFENPINHFLNFKEELDSLIKQYSKYPMINISDFYELLATLTYISIQIGSNKDKLFEKLKQFKPDLSEKLPQMPLEDMYNILIKFDYI